MREGDGGGPAELLTISGKKFYDANTNGTLDGAEPGIEGWRVELSGSETALTYTGALGAFVFAGLEGGSSYTVSEVLPSGGWLATTATSFSYPNLGPSQTEVNFGNVCLGPGGGLTLGFWSNKNGEKPFGADDLALMVSLNLRDGSGNNLNPADHAAFRTWILGATATNMVYMLSAQLAAMELNVLNGQVNGGRLIYAPGTTSANAAGFAGVNAIMAEANAELAAHNLTLAGSPCRSYQEALKNVLDNANNNLTFVQATPCSFRPY